MEAVPTSALSSCTSRTDHHPHHLQFPSTLSSDFFSTFTFSLRFPCPPASKQRFGAVHITSSAAVSPPAVEKENRPSRGSEQRSKGPRPRRVGPRQVILRPPLDDVKLTERFLKSPQLSVKTFPLLSSCLSPAPLGPSDREWMDEFLPEVKEALGYPLEGMENPSEESPLYNIDSLLYLVFQHKESARSKRARHARIGHSRLWFLGQYVLDLALAELFLQMFPRETPACIRERIFGLTNKKVLPKWVEGAAMDRVIFPNDTIGRLKANVREPAVKGVFWALIGVAYLTLGMGEVYRILFEVFGFDPYAKSCQPKPRLRQDEDYVSPDFEERQMKWQDIALYKSPSDSLFAKPRLLRACIPPGMHRFRGNVWEVASLPYVLQTLGYPRPTGGEDPDVTLARNMELELGLQLCFMHPSLYKVDHPRFCNERFEYIGAKIQDVVLAERLLMKHLDGPGDWLQEKHRRLLFNRLCGRYLREKKLHQHILYAEDRKELFEKSRRMRNFSTTAVQQALHGLAYMVYGKAEVRRLMFQIFDIERLQPAI